MAFPGPNMRPPLSFEEFEQKKKIKKMKKLNQLIKELSFEEIFRRIDQAVMLMGVIVEKLDEISVKLDRLAVQEWEGKK